MDADSLKAQRKDLDDGIKALQANIARANEVIAQAQANIHANQGAMQLIDKLLADMESKPKKLKKVA